MDKTEPQHPIAVFKKQLDTVVDEIPSSEDLPRDKIYSSAVVAVTKDPALLDADRASFFLALRQCATDGLIPDGKEAHLQIYNTKGKGEDGRDCWVKKVQYNPMVWGITKRVLNSGEYINFWAETICEGEVYEVRYENGCRQPYHIYDPLNRNGKIVGAYAVALNKSGMVELETMNEDDLQRVKSAAKTKKVWDAWEGEKSKVAVLRRISKRLKLSSEEKVTIMGNDTNFTQMVAGCQSAQIAAPTFTEKLAAANAPETPEDAAEVVPEPEQGEAPQAPENDAAADELEADPMSASYTAGANCFNDGIKVEDCPFEIGTQAAADWLGGWYGGKAANG